MSDFAIGWIAGCLAVPIVLLVSEAVREWRWRRRLRRYWRQRAGAR